MSGPSAHQPIEARLAAAGLPPLPRLAWLEIDVDALRGNLRAIASLTSPTVRLAPVVKADGYGHGLEVAARAFAEAGAALLCVATFDEGLAIRAAGITAPILAIFQVPPATLVQAAWQHIDVTSSDEGVLEAVIAAGAAGSAAGAPPLRVHVEIDTGLGRAGYAPERAGKVLARLRAAPGVEVVALWTHFATAPDPAVSAAQVERFAIAQRSIEAAGQTVPPRHLAASGAIFAASGPHFEMVRPGLALYGVLPASLPVAPQTRAAADLLRPAMSLKARSVRLERMETGAAVGYGGRWVATRPSLVATLPVGYGDGLAWIGAGKTDALVRGRRVPVVGSIAMDAAMVDVTDVPGVGPGDEYVLLGAQGADRIEANDLARLRTTIPYEVLVSMARRLPRVYDSAAGLLGLRTLGGETLRGGGSWDDRDRPLAR